VSDPWDPQRYARFRTERRQPFDDLLAMVEPRPGMRIADLGCGTGELTLELHQKLRARETVGIDSSASMLAQAPRAEGLRFLQGDLTKLSPDAPFDLVFSNAALHWVHDHAGVLRRLTSALARPGQIAVQMPMNDEHPSHQTAFDLARSPEFRVLLHGYVKRPALADPAQYASWLNQLGYERQRVELRVYGHLLPDRESVIEWVRGALLTDYQKRLSAPAWEQFLDRYRQLLLPQLPDDRPYFYTYPRLLLWGASGA
jgi:trans-aconitate 2-methyltransferase